MNYFQFYDIPVSFFPDEQLIKSRFYALSKEYHPDFFANESDEKQAEILQLSTINNQAYKTLSTPDIRIKHILEINKMIEENEKYNLPQDFLMEMMDINESLMEMEVEPEVNRLTKLKKDIDQLEAGIAEEMNVFCTGFEQFTNEQKINCLEKVKDSYYRKKYLLRIKDSLNKFATR